MHSTVQMYTVQSPVAEAEHHSKHQLYHTFLLSMVMKMQRNSGMNYRITTK